MSASSLPSRCAGPGQWTALRTGEQLKNPAIPQTTSHARTLSATTLPGVRLAMLLVELCSEPLPEVLLAIVDGCMHPSVVLCMAFDSRRAPVRHRL